MTTVNNKEEAKDGEYSDEDILTQNNGPACKEAHPFLDEPTEQHKTIVTELRGGNVAGYNTADDLHGVQGCTPSQQQYYWIMQWIRMGGMPHNSMVRHRCKDSTECFPLFRVDAERADGVVAKDWNGLGGNEVNFTNPHTKFYECEPGPDFCFGTDTTDTFATLPHGVKEFQNIKGDVTIDSEVNTLFK
jgi:hypothetical protein